MAPPQKKMKIKTYPEEIGFKKSPGEIGPISMSDSSTTCIVDHKKLVKKIMGIKSDGYSTENKSKSVDFKLMKLDEKNIAIVLPGRLTEVTFFPTKDTRMLAVGNVSGDIGFWNVDSNDDDNDGIYVYHPHKGLVSGISIHPHSLSKVISSCYDGIVRILDVEKESFCLPYKSDYPIFSISRPYDNINTLFIGEGDGSIGILDIRSSSTPANYNDTVALHHEKIYTIDFNSQDTNLMVTGSKDHTACIWDLRKLHPPEPIKLVKHKGVVNSAYFSPSGNLLATTSQDNNIGLMSGKNFDVESMIYHHNETVRFISTFRGIWGWDDCSIMVGNKKVRGVDIICAQEKKLSYTLVDPNVNAIPCRFDAHPMLPGVLATTTAGGRVFVWDI